MTKSKGSTCAVLYIPLLDDRSKKSKNQSDLTKGQSQHAQRSRTWEIIGNPCVN